MPLLMSCIAGGSTCLGAAVVFCQPRSNKRIGDHVVPTLVSEGQLSFSLSLAASVMITVSVVSIGPECLSINAISPSTTDTWISIWSMIFVHRAAAFALGCVLYVLLSCFAFPDADVILGLDQPQDRPRTATPTTTASTASSRSNSPLLWEEGSEPLITVIDDTRDMEVGGETAAKLGAMSHEDDISIMASSIASSSSIKTSSTNTARPSARRVTARQRRLLRKGSKSYQSDDDITTTSDDANYDDIEPMDSYEKTDNTTSMSLTTPSWWWWTGMRKIMQSCCCCCCGMPSSLDSTIPQLTLEQRRSWRVAMLLFVSLLCHNFPEGLAVAASALESPKLGMTVTIGIMIHNIPEGIAIAVPCLAARPHQPCLAFWLASLSGLAEPLGALVSLSVLRPLTTATAAAAAAVKAAAANEDHDSSSNVSTVVPNSMFLPDGWLALMFTMENILAFVAGIMITVALMDLFPEAWRHSRQSKVHFITGTLLGITIMVATEWYLP